MTELKRKAIFFDVDGTLIDYSKGMSDVLESTRVAIDKAKENGHLTVLATGRPKSFIREEIARLDFDAYITSNGAYIEKDGKVIYNKEISKETLRKAIELFRREKMLYLFEGQRYSYASKLDESMMDALIANFNLPIHKLIDNWKLEDVSTNKMVIFIKEKRQLDICMEQFGREFNFMRHPGLDSYDVYYSDCTKADGIKKFTEHEGIDIADTYAFGDGINDIEMLQTVKHGIAMGNANEKLKKVANFITNDVLSNGIYNGLIKYELI